MASDFGDDAGDKLFDVGLPVSSTLLQNPP